MPDWSYRTVLRPLMLALGPERSRRLALATLGTLSRFPLGLRAIDFLGHMRADERLRTRLGSIELAGPVALGAMIDPSGAALPAFARFGVGLLEVGPVGERGNGVAPDWRVDRKARRITAPAVPTVSADELARNLERVAPSIPICVRIAEPDGDALRRIVQRFRQRATLFSIEAAGEDAMRACVAAAEGRRPVLLYLRADAPNAVELVAAAMRAGAAGIWVHGDIEQTSACVRSLSPALPNDALIVAGGVMEPEDVRQLIAAGANVAAVDAGLVLSGPGLVKRCNEALLSTMTADAEPEPLTLDAARRAWFWALLLGVAMFAGGLLAIVIASTRVVLPYDESLCGMTRAQLVRLNPRLLPFMAHDRVSLAGTMLSIGIFYMALAWSGIRQGAHWAQVTVIASATTGFFSFFFFLAFGYFDPFHAFVTAVLTQFTLLLMAMQTSPPQQPRAEWRESPAWRRGQWGQLLFILIGATLTGAGIVISTIGCTEVFVKTDLEFMRTTAAQLRLSYERLVPLVAHDRASLGGMLIANGIAVWLSAQWGFRAGSRWLWLALAWGGNIAFASAAIIHFAVGYGSPLHLAPAMGGWVAWNGALGLSRAWLCGEV
jgi:dihydroorotate dehydrogenase